jgi:two-component system chemotaxis sensor kinase CheA
MSTPAAPHEFEHEVAPLPDIVRRLDELSTSVLLKEPTPEQREWLIAELLGIGRLAAASGACPAAQYAEELASEAGSESGIAAERLTAGLAKLQAALSIFSAPAEPAAASLANDPELIADFVFETREHLTSIEGQLLILEKDPRNIEAVHSTFRSFHTIKGIAGFLELTEIQAVAHEVESLLDRVRNAQLTITPEIVDLVLSSADYVRGCANGLERGLEDRVVARPPSPGALTARIRSAIEGPQTTETASVTTDSSTRIAHGQERANGGVRVDTARLDHLVDMMGEMVIAQSLVQHDPALENVGDAHLACNLAQLSRITAEVQRTAMAMRMVPIRQLFGKVARLVRDLARKSGKQVRLETVGEDTELDRTIVEDLADPLLHMVRNAVDHGIELPDERRAAGKPETGCVSLRASHLAGNIVLEIADDGRGLNRQRILSKAMELGKIDESRELSDAEVGQLIFQPGFSTANTVTDVSGRGVGMDVVRRRLERMRGRIEMQSAPGLGTRFVLRLPLTLAIIDGLLVGVGAERYIVPIFAVRETLRPAVNTISSIENTAEVALIRNQFVPVLRLARCFGVQPTSDDPCRGVLIVSETEGRVVGLLVDELIGKQEVVIKSLGDHLGHVPGIAGAAILGDGRVGLILDVQGLYDVARNAGR